MGVSRSGILLRIIVALLIVIAVVVAPERQADIGLVALSSVLFLLMAAALVYPWRKPDLLGWEFFGLFLSLGILFGVAILQTYGWIVTPLPPALRSAERATIVIFEAGVLTGLVRIGGFRLRMERNGTGEQDARLDIAEDVLANEPDGPHL